MAFNIALPTLGGMQLWQDHRVRHSWRMQNRVGTDHWRVLAPNDVRRARGTRGEVSFYWDKKVAPEIARIEEKRGKPEKIIFFLHGILEFKQTFCFNIRDMAREARRREMSVEVFGINYASTRRPIPYFADALGEIVDALPEGVPIVAVSHSMGGLVLNKYLSQRGCQASEGPHPFETAVYIGTPFAGSPWADWLKNALPYRMLFGPSGQLLFTNPQFHADIPWPDCRTVCIAGSSPPNGYFPWEWMIKGDDDGIVGVDSALHPSADERVKLPGRHEIMQMYSGIRKKTVEAIFGPRLA
jgi:pimeloyl-ACP methyl ester carboxylesterase